MTERDTDTIGGSLYNSLLYISAEGTILGVHRKLMPTHAERIVWGQGDGSDLLVVETGVGRVGGLICWEHWMPLARFAMHAEREEIHVASGPRSAILRCTASRAATTRSRAAASRSA